MTSHHTTVTITHVVACVRRRMMDLPDDVFDHMLRALDPGLDWVACRFVCRRWHERILAVTPDTFMWMAPLRLLSPVTLWGTVSLVTWTSRLAADLATVQRTPAKERVRLFNIAVDDRRFRRGGPWYYFWRRVDGELDSHGRGRKLNGWRTSTSTVSAQLVLLVRNVRWFLDTKQSLCKPFAFAGALWHVIFGASSFQSKGQTHWRFGVRLRRAHPHNTRVRAPKSPRRTDRASLHLDPNIPCAIRYEVTYHECAAGTSSFVPLDVRRKVIDGLPLSPPPPPWYTEACSGLITTQADLLDLKDRDDFPLVLAAHAYCGAGVPDHDLRISIKLEHIGYGFDMCGY